MVFTCGTTAERDSEKQQDLETGIEDYGLRQTCKISKSGLDWCQHGNETENIQVNHAPCEAGCGVTVLHVGILSERTETFLAMVPAKLSAGLINSDWVVARRAVACGVG
jgi:hypothetical protein